jgi:osmoprotectant transport system ATP-binding protein
VIAFEHITKRFQEHLVLDDVSFAVRSHEFCAIIGPSGAGKSTLLRLVNRLITPDAGTILIDDEDIHAIDPVTLRRRLGYVIQSIGLFPHWTVAENIATVPRLLNWPKPRIDARVDELLALVALEPATFRDRKPSQLSGGQQQRVGLARALAADPNILLMDEPFGALDAVTRDTLQAEMVRIHAATGKTILMVTHDVDEAVRLAQRIVVLDGGKVVQDASPERLLEAPANDFVRALVGGEAASLRPLKVRKVGEWFRQGAPSDGPQIGTDDRLDTALARMLAKGSDTLNVVDERGTRQGAIGLDDIGRKSG